MADPFSIIAGTTGIIDVCVRVTNYLRDVNAATDRIEQDLLNFLDEFAGLEAVNKSIRDTWIDHHKKINPKAPDEHLHQTLWKNLDHALRDCNDSVARFGTQLMEIIGKDGHLVTSKLDGVKKVLRKQSKEKVIVEVRQQVTSHRDNLQVLLLLLNLYVIPNT